MNKFDFDISIQARTQLEAEAKLKAASTLMQHLTVREIAVLADIVKNDPVKTKIAKRALGL